MSNQSLSTLVRIYQRKDGPKTAAYLAYFQTLESLDEAVRFACHGKDGKIHDHQHLVGKSTLEEARKAIWKNAYKILACKSFEVLLKLVEDRTRTIDGFGVLAIYDTSLRLGAHRRIWPKVVYLHAGTKQGCKALGLTTSSGTVEMNNFPEPMRVLEPYQVEDFLCIFKDQITMPGRIAKATA